MLRRTCLVQPPRQSLCTPGSSCTSTESVLYPDARYAKDASIMETRCLSTRYDTLIATSAISSARGAPLQSFGKRPYLSDYKGMWAFLTPKSIAKEVAVAGILCTSQALLEYNQHLDAVEEAQAKGTAEPTLNMEAFQEKYLTLFSVQARKNLIRDFFCKLYHTLAVHVLDVRTVDRITKDLSLSFYRKMIRFNNQHGVVARKMLKTSFWASSTSYVALWSYDVVTFLVPLEARWTAKFREWGTSKSMVYLAKRGVMYCFSLCSSSIGFSVGCYITGNASYGGSLAAALFDAVACSIAGELLGIV